MDDYARVLPRRQKMRGDGIPSALYVSDELAQVRLALADIEDLPAGELGTVHVRRVIDATADMPATARARFGALSRFLDWCQDAGHIKANPVRPDRPRAASQGAASPCALSDTERACPPLARRGAAGRACLA